MAVGPALSSARTSLIAGGVREGGLMPWQTLLSDLGRIGAESKARPIVIAGGLGSTPKDYQATKLLLEERGFDVFVAQTRQHGFAKVQDDSARIGEAVQAASTHSRSQGGDGLITLLGHSKGGITSRDYLQRRGGIEHVAELITIGTPHNGVAPFGDRVTSLASSFVPGVPAVKQLSAASANIRHLNQDLPAFMEAAVGRRPDFRMVSIAGDLGSGSRFAGSDGLVSLGAARIDDSIRGAENLIIRDSLANHAGIAGVMGMHEDTLHAATLLAAGKSVDDVERLVSSAGR